MFFTPQQAEAITRAFKSVFILALIGFVSIVGLSIAGVIALIFFFAHHIRFVL